MNCAKVTLNSESALWDGRKLNLVKLNLWKCHRDFTPRTAMKRNQTWEWVNCSRWRYNNIIKTRQKMPQYDDSFLDSPIFRRRTRSYTVQKRSLPKSQSFHITTTPLLLAVTNHARTLSGSLSTCNLKGNSIKKFRLRTRGIFSRHCSRMQKMYLRNNFLLIPINAFCVYKLALFVFTFREREKRDEKSLMFSTLLKGE